jgi:hypothetical protein
VTIHEKTNVRAVTAHAGDIIACVGADTSVASTSRAPSDRLIRGAVTVACASSSSGTNTSSSGITK